MTTWIIASVIIFIIIMLAGAGKNSSTGQVIEKNEKFYANLLNGLTEPGKSALASLKRIYDENLALSWPELKSEMGVPDNIDSKDSKSIDSYLNLSGNETAEDFYRSYMLDITQRHRLQYKPLWKYNKYEALSQFQVNINENETLYEVVRRVEWYEEIVVGKDINYSGYNWRVGGFHTGRLSYSTQIIKGFRLQDIGTIYLTNKRIIFIGKHKNVNRSISYDKVLHFKLFQDGILLGVASGKLPLLKFYEHDNTNVNDPNDAFITNDGMNQFVRTVSRILTNTQDLDLKPNEN